MPTAKGSYSGGHAGTRRTSPRTHQVSKKRAVHGRRPKHVRGDDTAGIYTQKFETIYNQIVLLIGAEGMLALSGMIGSGGPAQLLQAKGVPEKLGQVFGRHYAGVKDQQRICKQVLQRYGDEMAHKEADRRAARQQTKHDRAFVKAPRQLRPSTT